MPDDFDVTEGDLQRMRAQLDDGIVRARTGGQAPEPFEEIDVMAEWQTEMRQLVVASYDDFVALAHLLTGDRVAGETLTRTALLAVFSGGAAPTDMASAELAVRREIIVTAAAREPGPTGTTAGDAGDRLADLAPRERAVMVSRYLEGLSIDQTAEMLGISPTAVRADTAESVKYMNSVLGTADPLTGPISVVPDAEGADNV